MLQLRDHTPFRSSTVAFPSPAGVQSLYITVKATFALRPTLAVAEEQQALRLADVYAPPNVLREPADIALCRPTTDVVLIGSAHAPGGRPVEQLVAGLAVASREYAVQVWGDRSWTGNLTGAKFTAPVPFTRMALDYERAFGGTHAVSDTQVLSEERNPAGCGFVGQRRLAELVGLPLPNLEDPAQPLRTPGDCPPPLGFGAIAPTWLPRRRFAGTYDERWQRERAPLLPRDFDARFFQVAHPRLIQPGYLRGGEPVVLRNLSAESELRFTVPTLNLEALVQLGNNVERPPLQLEMMLIAPDENRVELLFRAVVSCDKQLLRVRQVEIFLHALDDVGSTVQ